MVPRLKNTAIVRLGLLLSGFAFSSSIFAHKVSSVSLITHLDTDGGSYLLDAAMAVIPSEEQALNDQISPEVAARQFAEEYLVVLFDELEQTPELTIERINTSDEETPEELQQQEVVVKMNGTIPEGAKEYLLYLDPTSPMAVVMVVIKDEKPERRMQVILAGEYSRPVNIQPLVDGDPFDERAFESSRVETAGASQEESHLSDEPGGFVSGWFGVMTSSPLLVLLPAAILLMTIKVWSTVLQLGVILIGQTTVVSLAACGFFPAILIAGPILGGLLAVVAFEALVHRELRWWRLNILFAAGAMAGALLAQTADFHRLFIDPGGFSIGRLILYVTGTELAFVIVTLVAAGVLLFLNRFACYEKSVVQPLAVLIGGYGVFEVIAKLL